MNQRKEAVIQWQYSGKPEALVGTGATPAEKALAWSAGGLGVLIYLGFFAAGTVDWVWWQYVLAIVLAADVAGGVVANSLNSCKRFYHSPLQPEEAGTTALVKNHMVFVALHVHSILIGLLVGTTDWIFGLGWYGLLLLSSVLVLRTPLYLQRPVAMFLILLAVLINAYAIAPVTGFEWFMPALFLKIVYGHLVREEPYRPASEAKAAEADLQPS